MITLNMMLLGAAAMAGFVASLFFLRFFKTTRDRFFLFFAIAFFVEGLCRVILGLGDYTSEQEPFVYLLRLASYLLIFYAILGKNLKRTGKK